MKIHIFGIYNIKGKDLLIYITPREIVSNSTRTYSSKTYEYTHGFGVIINSATDTAESGLSEYIQKNFNMKDSKIEIVEPRIYFGLQTNHAIIVNVEDKIEYDYPLTGNKYEENTYQGAARTKPEILG